MDLPTSMSGYQQCVTGHGLTQGHHFLLLGSEAKWGAIELGAH